MTVQRSKRVYESLIMPETAKGLENENVIQKSTLFACFCIHCSAKGPNGKNILTSVIPFSLFVSSFRYSFPHLSISLGEEGLIVSQEC